MIPPIMCNILLKEITHIGMIPFNTASIDKSLKWNPGKPEPRRIGRLVEYANFDLSLPISAHSLAIQECKQNPEDRKSVV